MISPSVKDVKLSVGTVEKLSPFKQGDRFIIPYDTYNSDESIQKEVLALMDSSQKTSFGEITWSMQTEKRQSGRVVVVFLVMK